MEININIETNTGKEKIFQFKKIPTSLMKGESVKNCNLNIHNINSVKDIESLEKMLKQIKPCFEEKKSSKPEFEVVRRAFDEPMLLTITYDGGIKSILGTLCNIKPDEITLKFSEEDCLYFINLFDTLTTNQSKNHGYAINSKFNLECKLARIHGCQISELNVFEETGGEIIIVFDLLDLKY